MRIPKIHFFLTAAFVCCTLLLAYPALAYYHTSESLPTTCAYGFVEPLPATGPMAKGRFPTTCSDDKHDQQYCGYRYYNPSPGRWISRDPIEAPGFSHLHRRNWQSTRIQPRSAADTGLGSYLFTANGPTSSFDALGLLTISFKVAGDSSGALFDVFNLSGMDAQIDTLKRVLSKCRKCGPDLKIEFVWDWALYDGPPNAQWQWTAHRATADERLARGHWKRMGHRSIPALLTLFPLAMDGTAPSAITIEREGILLNAMDMYFYLHPQALAHEVGHYAGYRGGDAEDHQHQSQSKYIMHRGYPNGGEPDKDYCTKVLGLAK